MNKQEFKHLTERIFLEDTLRQKFEQSLPDKIDRHQEARAHQIIPHTHFASVSAECYDQYVEGHFYGAISLVQAIAEAIVRFMCQKNGLRQTKSYQNAVNNLKRKGFIDETIADHLENIYKDRHDYHHLNQTVESDRQKLAELAKNKLASLQYVESMIFAFNIRGGKLVLKYPQYWDKGAKPNTVDTYLRFD